MSEPGGRLVSIVQHDIAALTSNIAQNTLATTALTERLAQNDVVTAEAIQALTNAVTVQTELLREMNKAFEISIKDMLGKASGTIPQGNMRIVDHVMMMKFQAKLFFLVLLAAMGINNAGAIADYITRIMK